MESYVITSACIGVLEKSCVAVCPVQRVYEYEGGNLVGKNADGHVVNGHDSTELISLDGAEMFCVHREQRTACELCFEECPVGAIVSQDALSPELAEFIDINRFALGRLEFMKQSLPAQRLDRPFIPTMRDGMTFSSAEIGIEINAAGSVVFESAAVTTAAGDTPTNTGRRDA